MCRVVMKYYSTVLIKSFIWNQCLYQRLPSNTPSTHIFDSVHFIGFVRNTQIFVLHIMNVTSSCQSTHLPLVPHICVSELGHHGFRYRTGDKPLPEPMLVLLETSFSEIWIEISSFSFKKMHLKMSAKMAAILSRGRWVILRGYFKHLQWSKPQTCHLQ